MKNKQEHLLREGVKGNILYVKDEYVNYLIEAKLKFTNFYDILKHMKKQHNIRHNVCTILNTKLSRCYSKNLPKGFKRIPGFSKYAINNSGMVINITSRHIKKTYITHKGYERTNLVNDNGKNKTNSIHRLVMLAFKGPSDLTVDHLDNNKLNNNLDNLEYVTVEENSRRAHLNGLYDYDVFRGEKNVNAKLTDEQVKEIYEFNALSHTMLTKRYGVGKNVIMNIRNDRGWVHVTKDLTKGTRYITYVNDKDVKAIYENKDILSNRQLSEKYNVNLSTITDIRLGVRHVGITKDLIKGKNKKDLAIDVVKAIYENEDNMSYVQLSNKYNVSCGTISGIRNDKTYTIITKDLTKGNNRWKR